MNQILLNKCFYIRKSILFLSWLLSEFVIKGWIVYVFLFVCLFSSPDLFLGGERLLCCLCRVRIWFDFSLVLCYERLYIVIFFSLWLYFLVLSGVKCGCGMRLEFFLVLSLDLFVNGEMLDILLTWAKTAWTFATTWCPSLVRSTT